ncbi:MAG: hypothetical protein ACLVJ6_09050 [Merdibacter sp.]
MAIARPPHFYPALEPVSYQVEPAPAPEEGDKQPLSFHRPVVDHEFAHAHGKLLMGTSSYAESRRYHDGHFFCLGGRLDAGQPRLSQAPVQRAFQRMDNYIERLEFQEEAERRMDDMVAAC